MNGPAHAGPFLLLRAGRSLQLRQHHMSPVQTPARPDRVEAQNPTSLSISDEPNPSLGASVFHLIFGRRPLPCIRIAHAPADANWTTITPRPGRPVSAVLATSDGSLQTSGGSLRYLAGEHYIVTSGADRFPVKRSIFERTYARQPDGSYQKRTDVRLRYFTLPCPAVVLTAEGPQRARAGDWIIEGVEGEVWPVPANSAPKKYQRAA